MGIVKPLKADMELCLLSVADLSFPEFSSVATPQDIEAALFRRCYSFYDYAVACWAPHLVLWASSKEEADLDNAAEIAEALESLLDSHYTESGFGVAVTKTMHEKLKAFQTYDLYDPLAQAVI